MRRGTGDSATRRESRLPVSVTPPASEAQDEARTMGEEVYVRLRSDLLAGRLHPGQKLPLRQLSAHYNVGIAPLREALSRLASERLVHFEGQRGYAVAPISLEDLHDLCSLRIDLSCKALRKAIERGDEDWEAEILAALHRLERSAMPESLGDDAAIDEWERRHDRFHHSLISACGSPWLLHFCQTLSDQFQRYRRVIIVEIAGSQDLLTRVRRQHRMIAEAAIARDADKATDILARHFEGSVKIVADRYAKISGKLEGSGKRRARRQPR